MKGKSTSRAPKKGGDSGTAPYFVKGIRGSNSITGDPRPTFAFVGRSNVGKSSTINAILGTRLARPSATPGKTQEINYYVVPKVGYVVDLPGYGFARIPAKEQEKIRKMLLWYLTGGEAKFTCVVLVIDAVVGFTDFDREMIALLTEHTHPFIVLANKTDKLSQSEHVHTMRALEGEFPDITIIPFSAKKGTGVEKVRKQLLS